MSFYIEPLYEKSKTLELIGSQINLTPRSDHSICRSFSSKSCRLSPSSASYRTQAKHKPICTRPKSAECNSLHIENCNSSLPWSLDPNRNKNYGDSSLTVSHFIDSSSKLLQNLIETPNCRTTIMNDGVFSADNHSLSVCDLESEGPMPEAHKEPESKYEFFRTDATKDNSMAQKSNMIDKNTEEQLSRSLKGFKFRELFPDFTDEKTVRFLDSPRSLKQLSGKTFDHDIECPHFRTGQMFYARSKSELFLPRELSHSSQRKRKTSDPEKLIELENKKTVKTIDCDIIKNSSPVNKDEIFGNCEENEKGITCKENDNDDRLQTVEDSNNAFKQSLTVCEGVDQLNSNLEEFPDENKLIERTESSSKSSSIEITLEESVESGKANENTNFNQKENFSDSTYEEIVHLLQSLEEEDSKSINTKNEESIKKEPPSIGTSLEDKFDYFGVVSSYLEEVELDDTNSPEHTKGEKWNPESFSSPRLEELLDKSSVELAHEVFSLKIQLEDQKKGIKLLKDTLAEMKKERKTLELDHQEALHKVNSEAEALVQRHQKFIKQLLNEKNNLNQTVAKLVQDLKSGEEKHKRNMKAIEEKHMIEIKRAKEAQAVADKIKREKWMEVKTQKIKEMTVKGLEPELSRMAVRQQEEMTELRNLHKAEIEAIELRAARRTSDLMDELRVELTKEKERLIAKETAALRASMEDQFEEERNKLQQSCQTLKDNIKKLEGKLSDQEEEFQQRLIDCKQEEEKKRQKIMRDHEKNVEEIQRKHLVELRNLRESLEAEKEVFVNNYKKKQEAKFVERETELHQQYKKERDREIEMVIETLENEASQIQTELSAAGEAKLKRLKEKMEADLKEIEESEAALKVKLSEAKSKLLEKEDFITELHSQIRQLQIEITSFKRSCEEMSSEKTKMKEIIREEFENSIAGLVKDKENLEKEMAACKELHIKELAKKDQINLQTKHEMQKELTRVYSRIKIAVNKKEKVIESLRQENGIISQKCRQLELMLDQQRRNLLLQ